MRNDNSLSIVILAAGKGSRMKSELPKVLQPLGGEPLLAHVLRTAQCLKPRTMTVVIGHGADRVRAAINNPSLNWVLQAQQQGTGHAVAQAIPFIDSRDLVLILYGDVPLVMPDTLERLISAASSQTVSLLSIKLAHPKGYGRIVRQEGTVSRIVEEKDATPEELVETEVNTGLLCVPGWALSRWLAELENDNSQGEYYLTDIIAFAVRDGVAVNTVSALSPAEVFGVNDKTELARAEATLRRRRVSRILEAGGTVIDPERVDIRGTLQIGHDVSIDTNVIFEGTVQLGNRVRIGSGCVLKDVSLGDDTEVLPYCVLEGLRAEQHCRIGPYARVRPQTTLFQNTHLGNFVEIKNSTLGQDCKAGHLAYIGDSTVGEHVNIGAGVVTANYDGAQKWRTVIEDGVFVGSGTMLIAPVTLKRQATIGAGSTITREAPANGLTLTRSPQVSKPDWRRPEKNSTRGLA